MKHSQLIYTFLILCTLTLPSYGQRDEVSLEAPLKYLRVAIPETPENFRTLSEFGIASDHGDHQGTRFITEISSAEYAMVKGKVPMEILIDDMEEYYVEHSADPYDIAEFTPCSVPTPAGFNYGTMGGYLTLAEMLAELDEMAAAYPNLITVKAPISSSLSTAAGRQVYYVKISDNPNTNETEPKVLYTGVHHAREPMSMMNLIFYMHYLLENYASNPEVQNIVNNTQLFFVPCLNPDGYEYNRSTNPNGGGMWRKNRRNNGNGTYGVDLNRNYGYQWGLNSGSSSTTSSDTYRGPSPFSEPETRMVRDFCIQHSFVTAFNEHSYSNIMIQPWEYTNVTANPALITPIADDLTSCNNYQYGNTPQLLGYYASGTATDWFYGEQTQKPAIIAFTPEIGSSAEGFWPPQSAIIPLCNSMIYANARLAEYAISLSQCAGLTTNAGADQTICLGASANLSATANGGTAPFTYTWSNGTSTSAQTITPGTTTTYTITVTDANGCTSTDAVVVSVNNCNGPCGAGTQATINTQGFETGMGIWTDPGTDCARVAAYPNTGTVSLRLRDNTTTSLISTGNLNLTAYSSIQISFSYLCISFDNATEDFWLQVSTNGGTTYTTVEEWNFSDEFTNGVRKNDVVTLTGPFTSTMRFRFRCDASDDDDQLHLDDIQIKGCLPSPSNLTIPTSGGIATQDAVGTEWQPYPNPVVGTVQLRFDIEQEQEMQFNLFDAFGKSALRFSQNAVIGSNLIQLDLSSLPAGVYYLTDQIGHTARILKL